MDTFKDLDDLLLVFGIGGKPLVSVQDKEDVDLNNYEDDTYCEPITDALVEEYMTSCPSSPDGYSADQEPESEEEQRAECSAVSPRGDADSYDVDDPQRDLAAISSFIKKGCGCRLKCSDVITEAKVLDNILLMREMLKETKEAHIMSNLVPVEDTTRCTDRNRSRKRCSHYFSSRKVCKTAFEVIFDVKKGTRKRLQKHVCEHGIEPRVHGLTGRQPGNAFKQDVIKNAVQFLLNYATEEGLPQPAPLRGRAGVIPVFLPVKNTKQSIHQEYANCCKSKNQKYVGLTTFKNIWDRCLPHIKIMGPKDDVCKKCEDFIEQISLARSDEDKLNCTSEYHAHVLAARTEHQEYKKCVSESTSVFESASGDFNKVHVTFDFSQYLKLPHHAREKSQTFFIQPRKVQLFGFCIDGFRQYNYLIDEDQTIGKDGQLAHGPDSVISMLDHAFTEFGVPGEEITIHADNCFAQNKNRYVIGYFCWRTMTSRHGRIRYMMQLPGHTRCLIDAGFGRIKQKYRREDTDTVDHLASVVEQSSTSNVPVLYGRWEWRAWKQFLGDRFKKVPAINKFHYFRFDSGDPGAVYMRMSSADVTETRFVVCKTPLLQMDAADVPYVIPPAGLSEKRKKYM